MNGKLVIKSKLKILTGLHIGGSTAFSAIGAVDNPIVIDTYTRMPIIPGSSIKGKMRVLLAKSLLKAGKLTSPDNDPGEVKRLFGAGGKNIVKSRLQFADAFVSNIDAFPDGRVTEVKIENTIDRITATANPRQIERVISGTVFDINIVYDIEDNDEIDEDMDNIALAMKLLQLDYLGGYGTRGSGRVSFTDFDFKAYESNIDDEKINKIKEKFEGVKDYELLSI